MNNVSSNQNFRQRRNNNNFKKGGGRQDFRRGPNNNGGNNGSFNTGGHGSHHARHPELDIVIDARAAKRASMMRDKYQSMSRDAQTGGDRVYAEYCLQHVEHYNRVLNAYNESRPQHLRENTNENADDAATPEAENAEAAPVQPAPVAAPVEEEPYQAAAN